MFEEEWSLEQTERYLLSTKTVHFGVSYLDDALGGILPNELMLIGARTGRGKTELATFIACQAAKEMKRVAFFALEADQWEIQRRLKYRKIVQAMKQHFPTLPVPRFREWLMAGYDPDMHGVEKILEKELRLDTSELKVVYKNERYTAEHFVKEFEGMQNEYDLFIIDHLHYFDTDEKNESEGLKKAIHSIRNAAIYHGKPVILLAHLRKANLSSAKTLPDIDDFHGHSDIVKVSTTVLLLAPVPPEKIEGNLGSYPTYFHIAKCRTAGEVTPYAAIMGFDFANNKYSDDYFLQKTFLMKDPEPIESSGDIPKWAKHAIKPKSNFYKELNGGSYKDD